MSEGGYKIRNQAAAHFITVAVVEWVDVFTRKEYRDIVLESIKYWQDNKGLLLHGWCIMSNHLHLIVSAKNHDLSDVLRDFKKFTSKQIIQAIKENEHESRREWMLRIFREECEKNSRNSNPALRSLQSNIKMPKLCKVSRPCGTMLLVSNQQDRNRKQIIIKRTLYNLPVLRSMYLFPCRVYFRISKPMSGPAATVASKETSGPIRRQIKDYYSLFILI
jgi:REP element-mobilizing transposase RayT